MKNNIHESEDTNLSKPDEKADNSHLRDLSEEVSERKNKTKSVPTDLSRNLSVADFNTAIAHFYRGEISRSNEWRRRLDTTTNWAVLTAGATLSFVFSSPRNPHFAIPINTILVTIFLFMEARRYRYYEVWANRVRVLEAGYFAPMFSYHSIPPDKEWAEHISEDLLRPHFTITQLEALGRRLRANYIWIFALLALSWTLKVYLHPLPAKSIVEFVARAEVGLAPGGFVIAVGAIFNTIVFLVGLGTLRLHNAASEVEPREDMNWRPLRQMSDWAENEAKKRKRRRTSSRK